MDEYRKYVEEMAEKADGRETILNRTTSHAAIIVQTIFSKAERIVEIISGKLDDEVWGLDEVCAQAIAFLARREDSKLRIVLEQKIDIEKNKFLAAIRRAGLISRVKLFHASEALQKTYGCHIMIADGQHYRFQGDRNKFEAIIQFGNVERGLDLRHVFASLREQSAEVQDL